MKNIKILLISAGTCLLLVLLSCSKSSKEGGDFQRKPLPTTNLEGVILKSRSLSNDLSAAGTLLPFEQTELKPEVSGRVVSINLPEGKPVSKGTLLVKIFDQDLQSQLKKLETQLAIARTTADRLKGLLQVQGASQQEYDLAELQVKNTQAEMDLVRIRIGQTEIRAPFTGVIGLRQISPGAYISPSSIIATIRDESRLRLDFTVPEKYGSNIKPGQTIQFTVDGSDRTYKAVVYASERSVSETSRELQIRATVSEKNADLSPGRFANVALSLTAVKSAILIPTEAIIPQARDKKVIIAKNGKASFVNIQTGIRQSNLIEVTEGLQEGDTLITTGILFLRPGSDILLSKINEL